MTQDAPSLNLALQVITLLIAGGYVYASYAVGRHWRDQRGRSLRSGFILSLIVTPLAGLIVGKFLEPDRAVLDAAEAKSLHDVLQETYRDVDAKLHAHP